jgi:hypothetical protein
MNETIERSLIRRLTTYLETGGAKNLAHWHECRLRYEAIGYFERNAAPQDFPIGKVRQQEALQPPDKGAEKSAVAAPVAWISQGELLRIRERGLLNYSVTAFSSPLNVTDVPLYCGETVGAPSPTPEHVTGTPLRITFAVDCDRHGHLFTHGRCEDCGVKEES